MNARIGFINIGFGSMAAVAKMVAIVSPDSAPIKRIIQVARDGDRLVDATYGRRTRSVIICDSDHVMLSAVQPETLLRRLEGREAPDAADYPSSFGGEIIPDLNEEIPSEFPGSGQARPRASHMAAGNEEIPSEFPGSAPANALRAGMENTEEA